MPNLQSAVSVPKTFNVIGFVSAPTTKGPGKPTTFTPFADDVSMAAGYIFDALENGKNSARYPQLAKVLLSYGPLALDVMARVSARHPKASNVRILARHWAANMSDANTAALKETARLRRIAIEG